MNLEKQIIVNTGKLHNIDLTELLYADDTLIMASTAAAAETIFQHIELESGKYNMNLNHTKCIHLRLHDFERIIYMSGREPKFPWTRGTIFRESLLKWRLQGRNFIESQTRGTQFRNWVFFGKRRQSQ